MQRAACRRQGGLIACAVALLSSAAVVGCSKSVAPPRSSDEIFQEQLSLPALYITESGKQITAPRGDGAFVDKSTGEIAWPALACTRPDCPARESADKPFLFVSPDPTLHVGADGVIEADQRDAGKEPPHAGQCPKCWEGRDLKSESAQQKQQFIDWVQPYILPKTERRLAELEAERVRSVRRERHTAIKNAGPSKETD